MAKRRRLRYEECDEYGYSSGKCPNCGYEPF